MKDEHKDAIEVSIIFHEGQRMMAVPKQPAPVQEPAAWLEILRNNKTATDEVIGAFLRGHAEYLTGETFVLATPFAQPAPVQGPDWKAEYLKSVESGCITLDELREALAELDATNRQVEILSDALAESRREVAALAAPVQEPVAWLKTIETLGGFGKFVEAKPNEKGAKPVYLIPPAAQPAVPDAFGTREGEHPEYIQGWNDCRLLMLKGMKP
jgi:hypothetical protein